MKLFFYLCFSFVVANVFANEEQLTYVPVGQADIFAEKMLINNLEFEEGISEQKSRAESWYKIIQNNFSFYKHLFSLEAAEQKNAYVHINFEDWAKKDVSYFLAGKAGLKEGKVQLKIKLYQVNKKEVLHTATVILEKDGFRSMAHSTSNDLYKAITGKDSIFGTKIYFASDRTSIG